jgi:predicted phosphohydrolase
MNVWAISDLHLSLARPDRQKRYTARWRDHVAKIERNWRELVHAGDLVLLPGDFSLARNHRDLQRDLAWLQSLPGTKVLGRGNHDRWWNSVAAIRPLLRTSELAVDGDAVTTHGVVVCGAAAVPVPSEHPTHEEHARVERALGILARAMSEASRLRTSPRQPLYVLWHYPPFDGHWRPGPWVAQLEDTGASACVYGHLHIERQWAYAVQGNVGGVRYYCVAADAIGFRPLRIDSFEGTSWS